MSWAACQKLPVVGSRCRLRERWCPLPRVEGTAGTGRRLTIFTEMDAASPSTRYRALQHVDRLRTHFDDLVVSMPNDTLIRPPGVGGQTRYFAAHAARYASRTHNVGRTLANSDIVLVQRGFYPMGPALVGAALARFGGRIVLDIDDSIFGLKPDLAKRAPLVRWLFGSQQARAALDRADAVIVSTHELANQLDGHASDITVLPTVPDVDRYLTVTHAGDTDVRIGWAGTRGNLRYLDPLAGILEQLAREHIGHLEVVSSEPWIGPASFRTWHLSEESDLFRRFAIGIMPLPDGEYTRAKAGFKLLQYMASAIPVVASPVGVNRELVERSQSGFLATSPSEWEDALRRLARDPDLRARMGQSGRAFVQRYADLDEQARTLVRVLTG